MSSPEPLIPKHGGFRKLKSFQVARVLFDVTVRFCDRYIDRYSRTRDQMIQAARSGVQNIAEGSEASATSKNTELKLTQVARASLEEEELVLDYEDFLRQSGLPQWSREDPRRQRLVDRRCRTADDVARWIVGEVSPLLQAGGGQVGRVPAAGERDRLYAEYSANAALVLGSVACYLLDRQMATLARDFEQEGGFTERLYRVRKASRGRCA